jgi:hypothetical protein
MHPAGAANPPEQEHKVLGYVIGSYLQLVMVFGPAVLICFTRRAHGWIKARWVFFALLPWLIGQIALLAWYLVASQESQVQLLLFGSGGVYVATWIAGWIIYFVFLARFKKAVQNAAPGHEPRA